MLKSILHLWKLISFSQIVSAFSC